MISCPVGGPGGGTRRGHPGFGVRGRGIQTSRMRECLVVVLERGRRGWLTLTTSGRRSSSAETEGMATALRRPRRGSVGGTTSMPVWQGLTVDKCFC